MSRPPKDSYGTSLLLLLGLIAIGGTLWLTGERPALAEAQPGATAEPQPVEESMHEFMEYVFEPSYLRLQKSMAAAPADNAGWKAIKGDSLVLAEATNLLVARAPEENGQDWIQISSEVRTEGAALYAAAKKKDYAAARSSYEAMLNKCNSCHEQFHKGKPVLTP
jgi:hypothetical protein